MIALPCLRVSPTSNRASRVSSTTPVAHLTTGLRVERRVVEHHDTLLTRRQRLRGGAIDKQLDHLSLVAKRLVARETALDGTRDLLRRLRAELTRCARAFALRLHGLLEPRVVHAEPALARDIGGQVDRKTIGIVELEHRRPGQLVASELSSACSRIRMPWPSVSAKRSSS